MLSAPGGLAPPERKVREKESGTQKEILRMVLREEESHEPPSLTTMRKKGVAGSARSFRTAAPAGQARRGRR